ncbi:MAG: selenide, water dikinase SelD [Phycisphaerales bacterium]|nr:selenide, water dikinase SelD [Phycisphaerales bacterium]
MELTAQVLRDLPMQQHPNLIVGPEHFEDAGVYRVSADTAIVQTVDFFPPLVDDPVAFGRIAATNSLSDVYAMGGTPITALNIVGFPDKELPGEILNAILRGGAEQVAAAGAVIVGGHSVRDAEIKYGLAVTGTVHPDRVVTNGGAQPGDALVLTKPIGSGTLTSAAKRELIAESDLSECIAVMTTLNRDACAAMLAVGVNACTDITGFGLLGHAFEVAEASGVTVEIEAGAVPLMQQAYDLAKQGVLTRTDKATLAFLGERLEVACADETLVHLLADAQTSGGLLISLAADRLDALMLEMQQRQVPAKCVGQVVPRTQRSIRVR